MIDIPHKWPGKKRLHVIMSALRVLGVNMPPFLSKFNSETSRYEYTPYSKLTTKRQKELYNSFRSYVLTILQRQQEKR